VVSVIDTSPTSKIRYLCEGFYPIEAHNLMHAALLFALQLARRRHGPNAQCTRLDLDSDLKAEGATFKPIIGTPAGTETCQFTVLVDRSGRP
jgi:hypothetical protein